MRINGGVSKETPPRTCLIRFTEWPAGILCRSYDQALDQAVRAEFRDGSQSPDMVTVVNGIVVGLRVADNAGIRDTKVPEQKAVVVEHINDLGAVGADQRLARVTGQ